MKVGEKEIFMTARGAEGPVRLYRRNEPLGV